LMLSQLLTLYTTPVTYLVLDRLRGWISRKLRRGTGGSVAVTDSATAA